MSTQIGRVEKLISIGASNVELMEILNYKTIVPQKMFKEGDLAIFFSPGSIIDKDFYTSDDWHPNSAYPWKQTDVDLVQVKLFSIGKKSYWSEGIVAPMSWLSHYLDMKEHPLKEGDDVTQILKVKRGERIEIILVLFFFF